VYYSVMCVKILQNGSTLHGPVSITEFSSLSSLEIRRLPLQYIYGLQRQRIRLRSLTCIASLTSLQVGGNNTHLYCIWILFD